RKLTEIARQADVYLAAGIVEDLDFYHLRNSVALVGPNGHMGTAAEMHTPIARHPTFVGARECPTFDVSGIPIGIVVGDDVYYPELSRMLVARGARLLVA